MTHKLLIDSTENPARGYSLTKIFPVQVGINDPIRDIPNYNNLDQGKIRRIRGVAYSTRVSPQTPGRIVESARGILNQFLPDIFIFADVAKGQSCGKSPGYGCTLVAESTNENVRISAEIMSNTKGEKQISAEELGQQAALRLLEVGTLPLHHFFLNFTILGIECIWSL